MIAEETRRNTYMNAKAIGQDGYQQDKESREEVKDATKQPLRGGNSEEGRSVKRVRFQ
jgi:hypothetical protein